MIVRRAAPRPAAVYLVVTGMVLAFVLLLPAGAAAARAADPWTVTQLTNDRYMDFQLVADGDRLAWSRALGVVWGLDDQEQGDREVMFADLGAGGASVNISNNPNLSDGFPALDGDLMAWIAYGREGHRSLFLRDLARDETILLAAGDVYDRAPSIDGDLVVWSAGYGPHEEVYLYDHAGGATTRLTHNDLPDGLPEVSRGRVAWIELSEPVEDWPYPVAQLGDVMVYDVAAGTTTRIARPGLSEQSVAIDGDRLIMSSSSGLSSNLFLYDLSTGSTTRLTSDRLWEQEAQIEGDYAAWLGADPDSGAGAVVLYHIPSGERRALGLGGHVGEPSLGPGRVLWTGWTGQNWEIYAYDIATATTTEISNLGRTNGGPVSVGDRVAWVGHDGHDSELFIAAPAALAPPDAFRDVPGMHPYRTAISALAAAGVIVGYAADEGREFRPDAPVTRAQFAKMIVGALDLPVEEALTAPFTDLGPDDPSDLFPHDYVAVVLGHGITKGTGPATYAPYAPISRAQMITMAVRGGRAVNAQALLPVPGYLLAQRGGPLGTFDLVHAPGWNLAWFNGLLGGLIGYGSHSDPWQPATRAEVAQVLWNLRELIEEGGQ